MTIFTSAKPSGHITWADLLSKDPAVSRAFYQAVLGWHYDIGPAEFGGYATANAGKHTAAGIAGQMQEGPSMWQLYFASHDIKADVAKAVQLGAKVLQEPIEVGPFGSMAVLTDPTGGHFALWQAGMHIGAGVIDDHGAMGWHELYTPDAKKALAFYTALTGASSQPMQGAPTEYHMLSHGTSMLAGIMQIDPAWGNMPTEWVTYWHVVNIEAAVAAAQKAGGTLMGTIQDNPFGKQAALKDNTGANIKLFQPRAR